jgi:iron complex transport system permease protein
VTALSGVRFGPVGFRFRLRPLLVPLIASALTVLVVALNIRLGDFPMTVGAVLRTLVGAGDATEGTRHRT